MKVAIRKIGNSPAILDKEFIKVALKDYTR